MGPQRARASIKLIVVAAILVVAILAVVGVLRWMRPLVEVSRAVEGPVVQAFYATGTVQPVTEFPIRTNTAGIVQEVRVVKGDAVHVGDVLAVVSDPTLKFLSQKAAAELEEKRRRADPKTSPVLRELDAKIQASGEMLDIAKREESRLTEVGGKAASDSDRDKAAEKRQDLWSQQESLKAQRSTMLLGLETDLKVAQSAFDIAKENENLQTLRSPVDGVVLDRPVTLGTRLAINDHIMQVADVRLTNLVMRAAVDEEDIAALDRQRPVFMTLYSFPEQRFEGRISRVYDKAEPDRRTFEVDVKLLEPPAKLSAGMTGEMAFVTNQKERALVVPSQSVQGGAVYAVRSGKLTRADVVLGLKSIERVEIVSGLKPDEMVVISPVAELKAGQSVRVLRVVDPATAAGLNAPKATEARKMF